MRLVQIVVPPEWPGAGAELPYAGTVLPHRPSGPNLKRMYKGDDDKSYYTDFAELFAGPPDHWSDPKPVAGFRILHWENGEMGWHPCVTNQLAVVSAGEFEFEVGDGTVETFRAGDVCIAEDRTGEGHRTCARGVVYVTSIVIETANLWPWADGDARPVPA